MKIICDSKIANTKLIYYLYSMDRKLREESKLPLLREEFYSQENLSNILIQFHNCVPQSVRINPKTYDSYWITSELHMDLIRKVGGLEEYYEQSRISSKIHGLEVVTLSDKDREVFVTIVRNYGITDMVVSEVVQILYIPRKEEFVFNKILPVIEKCKTYKKETRNRIHLVISTQHGYDTTSNEIAPPEIDFDLNYNEDFKPVNDLIIDKLNTSKGIVLLHGAPGCLGRGTGIIMYDGTIKRVEDVKVGDLVMGTDSTPRTVLSTATGVSDLFKVTPVKGDPFICNDTHIHVLHDKNLGDKARKGLIGKEDTIVEIDTLSLLTKLSTIKGNHGYKIVRSEGIQFTSEDITIDPYFIGLWLGDGSKAGTNFSSLSCNVEDKEVINYLRDFSKSMGYTTHERLDKNGGRGVFISINKPKGEGRNKINTFIRDKCKDTEHGFKIPHNYLCSSREHRLSLLAGIIDSDGYNTGKGCELVTVNRLFNDQVLSLCRSLGLAAYSTVKQTSCQGGFKGTAFRISISGDLSVIPTKLPRKKFPPRRQIKSVLRTGFSIEGVGQGEWFGIKIDGDQRFLLEDFTITHNCGKSSYLKYLTGHLNKKVIFVPPNMASSISDPSFITFLSDNKNSVLVIEDAENVIKKRDGGGNQAISNLLNLSDGFLADVLNIGVVATFNCPVSDIDTALMRKGRMIAMYEFKELSVDRASKLSKKLGFGDVDKAMTLADIYNQEQEAFTQEKQTVGFKF